MTAAAAPAASSVRREIADFLARPDICFPSDVFRLAAGDVDDRTIGEMMRQFARSDKAAGLRL
jgi:hypothetical protein